MALAMVPTPGGGVVVQTADAVRLVAEQTIDLGVVPLSEGRPIVTGNVLAVLSEPTQRYPHGAIGARAEAVSLTFVDVTDSSVQAVARATGDSVFEAVVPLAADFGTDETLFILTESNTSFKIRVEAFW